VGLFVTYGCDSERQLDEQNLAEMRLQIVRSFEENITKLAAADNVAAIADLYVSIHTDDAVLMFPGMPPVVGRDAIHSFALDCFSKYEFVFPEWQSKEIVISGDWAFHRFSAIALIRSLGGGEPIRRDAKYIDILHREPDGQWKVARHIFNSNQ